MAKKKFYAVRQGRKIGMFLTWDECKKQVMGIRARYIRALGTEEEAKEYLGIAVGMQMTCREVIRQQVRWKSTLMEAIMQARKNFPTGWWF